MYNPDMLYGRGTTLGNVFKTLSDCGEVQYSASFRALIMKMTPLTHYSSFISWWLPDSDKFEPLPACLIRKSDLPE